MAIDKITALNGKEPPVRGDSEEQFVSKANAFLGAFPTLQDQLNDFSTQANNLADTWEGTIEQAAQDAATDATQQAGAFASASESSAEDSEQSAALSSASAVTAQNAAGSAVSAGNYRGDWVDLAGPLDTPASVSHEGYIWALSSNVGDVADEEPGSSSVWAKITPIAPNLLTALSDITSLASLNTAALVDGQQFKILRFWSDGVSIAVPAHWDATADKSTHNGVTRLDPNKASELNGATKEFGTWFDPAGSGQGLLIVDVEYILYSMAGALPSSGDQHEPMQAAIRAAESTGLPIYPEPGDFGITAPLLIEKPATIMATGYGSDTPQSSQPESPVHAITALPGFSGDEMILVQSATPGNRLWNVILKGFALRGENRAARGAYLRSTYQTDVDLWVERCTIAGVDYDDGNGVLSAFNNISRLQYNAGSNPACRKSTGLRLESLGTDNGGLTNFYLGHVYLENQYKTVSSVSNSSGSALFETSADHNYEVGDDVYLYRSSRYKGNFTVDSTPSATSFTAAGVSFDGSESLRTAAAPAFYVGDIDSMWVGRYQGNLLYFAPNRRDETPPIREARKNTFGHVGADVLADEGSFNTILSLNSEPSSVSLVGSGIVHYTVLDRSEGGQYRSPAYSLWSYVDILNNIFIPDDSLVESGTVGGIGVPALKFPSSGDNSVKMVADPGRSLDDGVIKTLRLRYTAAASGGSSVVGIRIALIETGEGIGSWDYDDTLMLPSPGANNIIEDLDVTIEIQRSLGGTLVVEIYRDGDDVDDTQTGDLSIIGASLIMISDGPLESGKVFESAGL